MWRILTTVSAEPAQTTNRRSRASESFFGNGGGWVVAQFLIMTSWVALTPKGHKLTDSALGRATAGVLVSVGAAAVVSGSIMLGKSLSPFPKPPCSRSAHSARTLGGGAPSSLRRLDRAQFGLGLPLGKR
jgi:hypothetical protein